MDTHNTPYGTLHIASLDEIFAFTVAQIEAIAQAHTAPIVGLTGGSTPKAFYQWAAQKKPFSQTVLERVIWSTSDERYVPQESDDSNFGHAERGMFGALEVAETNKRPWDTAATPEAAAAAFNTQWQEEGRTVPFALCLLGMGDDCHTASLFPQSPLISDNPISLFASVEVPDKGMRLSITPHGLSLCPRTVITVTGKGKVEALKAVLEGDFDPLSKPSQLLKHSAEQVTWLVDAEAAAGLSL